ncbi:MAG TPA: MBL fold metallo-hydrolase [Fimbriimonadaceae bacterium]|nr:MBL fold metallo-hydrolase [Fimbriimonadaceae bacterium]
MILERFYSPTIAQASYLIGSDESGQAIVVDPNRDVQQYLDFAKKEELRITAVTETHIHADFVSGSRELAQLTGATLYLSKEGGSDWQYDYASEPNVQLIGDGFEIKLGRLVLKAIHTPGHTPEHLSFEVIDGEVSPEPFGVLTGDFIFAGDVGRPDLLEVAAGYQDTMREGAETLFQSLGGFRQLPSWLTLWPGHGAGSACGKSLGAVPGTTLGYEMLVNSAVRETSADRFVADILSGQPEPPKYFARMKDINRRGPNPTLNAWNIDRVEPAGQLVDVRSRPEFIAGSNPGAISIPLTVSFSKWAGSLLDLKTPIVILANDETQARQGAKSLILIGIENIQGWSPVTHPVPFPVSRGEGADTEHLIDVRGKPEWNSEHVAGAHHSPLVYLADDKNLPQGKVYVHCAGGGRALTGASFLRSKGIDAVAVMASVPELKSTVK